MSTGRSGWWRRYPKATALAVIAAALGLGILVAPSGAVAFCPYPLLGPDCHPPPDLPFDEYEQPLPPGDPGGPDGGGGGQGPTNSDRVKTVSKMVENALKEDDCNTFVSGNQTGANDARTRWATNTITEQPNRESPKDADAYASVNQTDLGRGGGAITLWKPFFDDSKIEDLRTAGRTNPVFSNMVRHWSADQLRAMALLHEMAHLSGKLPADHKGSWGSNPSPQVGFHAELAFACQPKL